MADSNSTATSLEDRTEDLDTCDNPTRDTLTEGLLCLIRPTIDSLDKQVSSTLVAQVYPQFLFSYSNNVCNIAVRLEGSNSQSPTIFEEFAAATILSCRLG